MRHSCITYFTCQIVPRLCAVDTATRRNLLIHAHKWTGQDEVSDLGALGARFFQKAPDICRHDFREAFVANSAFFPAIIEIGVRGNDRQNPP